MKKINLLFSLLLFSLGLSAQNVGINTETPDSSAVLEVFSENAGILIPRLTTVQRNAILNPANSLTVFDTEIGRFMFYDTLTSSWQSVANVKDNNWGRNGNNIYKKNTGNVGIGTTSPQGDLHFKGDGLDDLKIIFSNGDSTKNIIFGLDDTEGCIFFKGEDGVGYSELLFASDFDGKFGIGTGIPEATLHVNALTGGSSIKLSAEGSNLGIIFGLDDTEGCIVFKGDYNNQEKLLFMADSTRKFGIGTSVPLNMLHMSSGDYNPAVRLTRTGYQFDYVFGYHANNSSFIINRDSVNGGMANVFLADENGDLTFNAQNNISLNPGITTPSVELNNSQGDSISLSVDNDGNLISTGSAGSALGSVANLLDTRFVDETMVLPYGGEYRLKVNTAENYSNSFLFQNDSINNIYDYYQDSSRIYFTESGYYLVSFMLEIDKTDNNVINFDYGIDINNTTNSDGRVGQTLNREGSYTLSFSKIIYLKPSLFSSNNPYIEVYLYNENVNITSCSFSIKDDSTISIFKLAN